ncbi:MAG: hypothetical protein L0154_17575 [Chloroflexi bacterium]|nr:hypothetical protein [Chloroflexota bacterium]
MSYYIRFFTVSPVSSLVPLQAQMFQEGYSVRPRGTNIIAVEYAPDRKSFVIELTDSTSDITKKEIADFIAAVTEANDSGRDTVLNLLTRTQSLIALEVPDDYEEDEQVLDLLIDMISNMGDGLFHVEDEGFYQNGELIVRL